MEYPFLPAFDDPTFRDALEDYLKRLADEIDDQRISSGPTTNRPANPRQFQIYGDTTLGTLIQYDGSAWVAMNGDSL